MEGVHQCAPVLIIVTRRACVNVYQPLNEGSRRGFTLAETLVSLVLLGVILGAMTSVLAGQQRFYRGVTDLVDDRGQVRQSVNALPADLRAISPSAGDIYSISDHAIEFRATIGSSVVCTNASTTSIILPPVTLTSGSALTMWRTAPIAGDSMFVYDDGASAGPADDAWRAYSIATITPVTGVTGCPLSSSFVAVGDTARASYLITLGGGALLSNTILAGAPIRFFRRVHYELYHASDSLWYLGYFDCVAARSPVCNSLQQLSGPYRAYSSSSSSTSGLLFTYYDSTGAALTASLANAPRVARIRMSVRGQTRSSLSVSGMPPGTYIDSLAIDVALRNRR